MSITVSSIALENRKAAARTAPGAPCNTSPGRISGLRGSMLSSAHGPAEEHRQGKHAPSEPGMPRHSRRARSKGGEPITPRNPPTGDELDFLVEAQDKSPAADEYP